ncbi:glycoside hydrolase family 3 protein [Altererythrobacter rubellus]|uniref:Glycoside hydrolase family 3 N-terminal domain-containing protein n=1 Tax=Altererythrobacter rubellus TaxID=2173831 RepID=A0A9Y2F597_9SPHN|nr:glycoside hydrolase family 3 protein [Altererythrobacter rubellus]WIW95785.1 glycoside hydrolase family 3 N-terminal domain-containing protein [Altererythrobacter rubellus]
MRYIALALATGLGLSACATVPSAVPAQTSPVASAEDLAEAEIADIVSRMSLERKIGQLIQPQINSFTPEDMERYRFGSYLNGGNGGPYGDEFAPASEWLRYADEMYDASVKPLPDGEPVIPTMWGTDAVHGHSNIVGATIFPHNIALGATGDAELVQRIGHATAIEIEVTGIDWNFSPTVAVARDDRWGRTYESYSEDPDLVAKLGAALIVGQQGTPDSEDFLGDGRVFVTAKHFFGDGGTERGVDQGDVNGDINALLDLHGRPYPAAIDAGVQAVMASFNSINGRKMHGNKELLTDVLRGQMGFDGLVVGDWNGHGQIKGCTVTDCPQSLMAGLDIYMVPDDWKVLMETLIAQVKDGTIPMARVDEAVTRVLRVKQRAGLLGENAKRPSERGVAGQYDLLASLEHRALAREAVAKSQVLLKNDGVLPLKAGANVLVAGSAADDVGQQSGGWTLEWQGGRKDTLPRDYFPKATSIWDGIKENVTAEGGSATLSEDGSFEARPDIAIVVFGEHPYAEFAGDQRNLVFRDEEGLTLLRQFDEQDIPTVAVFLSGRAMWMNREINAADAFVASWLPGSEGAGVADVLTGKREATGRLSFSWPASCEGQPVNSPEGALFAFGYGRTLSDNSPLATLNEDCGALSVVEGSELFGSGRLGSGVSAFVGRLDGAGFEELMPQMRGDMNGSGVLVRGFDRDAQEDSREITMRAGSYFGLEQSNNTGGVYRIAYEVVTRPAGTIRLRSGNAVLDVTAQFELATAKGFREMVVTESCLAGLGKRIAFESDGDVTFRISSVKREEVAEGTECSF